MPVLPASPPSGLAFQESRSTSVLTLSHQHLPDLPPSHDPALCPVRCCWLRIQDASLPPPKQHITTMMFFVHIDVHGI